MAGTLGTALQGGSHSADVDPAQSEKVIAERSEAIPGVVCEGGLDAPTKHDQM